MATRSTVVVAMTLVAGALVAAPTPAGAAAVRCHGERATIVGDARDQVLTGTSGRDVIDGRGGDDIIDGRGGDDVICGGPGADHLDGGAGDDDLYGGKDRVLVTDEGETNRTGDVLRGGPGDDTLAPGHDDRPADDIGYDAFLWDTAPRPVTIDIAAGTARGDGHDTFDATSTAVVGSAYADTIDGSSGDDRIDGGPGSDVVHAYAGDDRVVADSGHTGTHAADRVWGGRGDDALSARAGQDELYGGPGADVLDDFGNSADLLFGGPGADLLVGELVDNGRPQRYSGGPGVDRLTLMTNLLNPQADPATGTWDMASGALAVRFTDTDTVDVTVDGFEVADLSAYGMGWTVDGSDGADELNAAGTTGTTFRGLAGDDRFLGSASDDVFDGGAGTDRSLGMGVGDDTCISVEVLDQADCEHVSG